MKEISYEQLELFPSVTGSDTDKVQILLDQYVFMKKFIKEFEENGELLYKTDMEGERARKAFADELHADKTANAVILHEIRTWKYTEFIQAATGIEMGFRMIMDDEVKEAIEHRYIKGIPFMRAAREVRMDRSTFRRRLDAGIESIGNTLKLMGILERKWTF